MLENQALISKCSEKYPADYCRSDETFTKVKECVSNVSRLASSRKKGEPADLCLKSVPVLGIDEVRPFHSAKIYNEIYPSDKDKTVSLGIISLGKCNFDCIYCKRGGYTKERGLRIQGAKDIPFFEILDRAVKIVDSNQILRFSGGEPTLFMNDVELISKIIKTKHPDALISIATNMSNRRIVDTVGYIDIYAVDIKGPKEKIEQITCVPPEIGLDIPLRNLKMLVERKPKFIEIRTPVFEDTNIDDLKDIVSNLPTENFAWTLRPYSPLPSAPSKKLKPPSKKYLIDLKNKLIKMYPYLKDKIIIREKGF